MSSASRTSAEYGIRYGDTRRTIHIPITAFTSAALSPAARIRSSSRMLANFQMLRYRPARHADASRTGKVRSPKAIAVPAKPTGQVNPSKRSASAANGTSTMPMRSRRR